MRCVWKRYVLSNNLAILGSYQYVATNHWIWARESASTWRNMTKESRLSVKISFLSVIVWILSLSLQNQYFSVWFRYVLIGKIVVPLINTYYIRCIWGLIIKGPPSLGFSHHFRADVAWRSRTQGVLRRMVKLFDHDRPDYLKMEVKTVKTDLQIQTANPELAICNMYHNQRLWNIEKNVQYRNVLQIKNSETLELDLTFLGQEFGWESLVFFCVCIGFPLRSFLDPTTLLPREFCFIHNEISPKSRCREV